MNVSYDQAETFTPVGSLVRSTMSSGLVLFVPLVALTWFIVTSILAGLGVPVPWLFGIVLGGGLSAWLYQLRTRKLEAEVGGMTLTFDARGITQTHPAATRFVSWEGLRAARMVKPVVGMSTGKLGRAGMTSRTAGVDALASAAATDELGLVGVGTITLAPSAGRMQRETYRQNEARSGSLRVRG